MSDQGSWTEEGARFLEGLFDRLELDLEATPRAPRDEWLVIEIGGDALDVLERRADLLSALTQLTTQAVSRASGERVQVLLDVGGGFDARKALLEQVAADAARAVSRTGRRAVIDQLSSSERRVVHTALADNAAIATRSEGDEGHRLLLIERA